MKYPTLLAMSLVLTCRLGATQPASLEEAFTNPPVSAQPYVWWHWMGSNFSKEGITKDLEAMAASGIGGATIFNISSAVQETIAPTGNNPWPEQTYRGPAYWEALRHACAEARRLGLELGLHNTVGYSTTGGPWVDEALGMQKVIWRALEIDASSPPAPIRLPKPDQPRAGGWGSTRQITKLYTDIGVVAFPIGDAPTRPDQVVDLSALLGPDDQLDWTPPSPGRWQLLRFGAAPTGSTPHPVPDELHGKTLEADKLSLPATQYHWNEVLRPLERELGTPLGEHLRHFLIDSYEAGHQSWTTGFREEFQSRLGYDPLPWLPTLGIPITGEKEPTSRRILGDEALTKRFEHDYRTLVSDLFYEKGWKPAAEMIHAVGATLQFEPYFGPFDIIDGSALADLPMGEFWTRNISGANLPPNILGAARAAGRRVIGLEAFTGRPEVSQWTETPGGLKPFADAIYVSGGNRMVLHHWVHQPFDDRYQPGMGMGWWGTHFGRHQTWAEPGKDFFRYLGRVQTLLQRGEEPVDHVSVGGAHRGGDAISWRAFRTEVTVKDGLITLPSGRSYRLLHIPHQGAITPEDVEHIRKLLLAGATIVSPRPLHSPSLANYPACDARVAALAAEIWPDSDADIAVGAGRLFPHDKLADALRALNLQPFVRIDGPANRLVQTRHRRDGDLDIIFVANIDQKAAHDFTLSFLRPDAVAELWDPETGRILAANHATSQNGRLRLELALRPEKSLFVVLRGNSSAPAGPPLLTDSRLQFAPLPVSLPDPWSLAFASAVDSVPDVNLSELADLSTHAAPAVRHFSGTITYRTRLVLDAPPAEGKRLVLDLGDVRDLARVTLNGQDVGVLWHAPYHADVTGLLRPGDNSLEIAVSTTWHNRLVGDEQEPADFAWGRDRGPERGRALASYPEWFLKNQPRPSARKGFVTWFYHRADTPLRPSGLIGPVTLKETL